MLRLLIVDDEQYTRVSLLELMPYKDMGITEVQTARNGLSAYQLAKEHMPDILLCDIRMPRMDGLQLSAKLRELSPELKIIFISGYADKAYLKAAISLQAIGYVEKPIDTQELRALLVKASEQVLADRREQQQSANSRAVPGKVRQLVRQRLAADLVRTPLELSPLRETYGEAYWMWPDEGAYLAGCVQYHWPAGADYARIDAHLHQALQTCLSRLSGLCPEECLLCGLQSQNRIALIIQMESGDPSAWMAELAQALLPARGEPRPSIGFGRMRTRLLDIPEGFREAREAADWQAFVEGAEARAYQPWMGINDEAQPSRILAALTEGNPAAARGEILRLNEQLRRAACANLPNVRAHYQALLGACLEAEVRIAGETPARSAQDALMRLGTLPETTRFLLSHIDNIYPEIAAKKGTHHKVRQAIAYIRANLADPMLSIQSIADHLNLTENYLSALYKKETGMTLNQSITDARMERAKRLLEQDLKLYEVSQRSGYSDPNYFSVVFKKQAGVSPTQYRQSILPKDGGQP